MREVIAVCRSGKKSRDRTARILDRYFWRIGDRTWRGKASNACIDRVARELRKEATRNTAVTIHEIRSAHESRMPLIRIGSKSAFSDDGLVHVASHPSSQRRNNSPPSEIRASAAVRIAVLFHDLGKATILFQEKLRRAIRGATPKADPVRHELHSATVWDLLFGKTQDPDLGAALLTVTADDIDRVCRTAVDKLASFHRQPEAMLKLDFITREDSLSHLIGVLVLTHHRLPDGDSDHLTMLPARHINSAATLDLAKLAIAPGVPFWHEDWWLTRLRRDAVLVSPGSHCNGADIALRASLMFADHLGSAAKASSGSIPDHLANTTRDDTVSRKSIPADSLSRHVHKVYSHSRSAFDLLHRYRESFPALDEGQVPADVMFPAPSDDIRFRWQAEAARAARGMCEANEGGFFACLLSGTGTGKTRGAPTILANAALGDARPERRYLRLSLALGLRVLATQSAREYVHDLGFRDEDISVLVGHQPLFFNDQSMDDSNGSESLIKVPEWLRVEHVTGGVPVEGDERERDWLRSLSTDTDRRLPACCELILQAAGNRVNAGRRLIAPPVMVCTVDHLMGVASPTNSRFLIQSIRVLTSDLILDEVDQFDGEDIAAIGRLVFQSGAAGRRVVIMSATLTPDITEALHSAYRRGWQGFARSRGLSEHINLLCTGDTSGSCFTNEGGGDLNRVLTACRNAILHGLDEAPALRRGELLAPCETWEEMVAQTDLGCSRLHGENATLIDGFRVSVGMVRMTRIAHTAALAAQIPSGNVRGRLRVTLCLHSQFPRLHREWIETRLKRALTRKGPYPDKGVRDLCIAQNLFDRAQAFNADDIEVVVVTSPVIETGNDLDFDYAILDPVSMRAIIQSAGRVRRHRPPHGSHPNVLILGRSPIAMQGGKLAMPGVETNPAAETVVTRRSLDAFAGRYFRDLAGDQGFDRINAAAILSGGGVVPLRDEEGRLCRDMVNTDSSAPLGKYILHLNARMNLTMTRTRKFRRSERREILYQLKGERIQDAEWYVDLAPGTRESELRPAGENGLAICCIDGEHLFDQMAIFAWNDYSNGSSKMGPDDISDLMQVSVSDHMNDLTSTMVVTEFTGFTRGSLQDLFGAFGKQSENQ